jgi:hypothetical protein
METDTRHGYIHETRRHNTSPRGQAEDEIDTMSRLAYSDDIQQEPLATYAVVTPTLARVQIQLSRELRSSSHKYVMYIFI